MSNIKAWTFTNQSLVDESISMSVEGTSFASPGVNNSDYALSVTASGAKGSLVSSYVLFDKNGSVSAWVKLNSLLSVNQYVFCHHKNGNHIKIYVDGSDHKWKAEIGSTILDSGITAVTGEWLFVELDWGVRLDDLSIMDVTFRAPGYTTPVTGTDDTFTSFATNMYIGNDSNGGNQINGLLDNVMVAQITPSESQIVSMMADAKIWAGF